MLSPRVPWEVVMFIAFTKRRFACSTSTSLAHMAVETIARGTWSPFFFFPWIPTIRLMIILALQVGFTKSTFQLWSQVLKIQLLHCHSLSVSQKQNKNKKWTSWLSLEGTWHKSVSSHCLYYGEWVPVATKIMNLLKKSQPSCLKFLEAKRGEGQQDIIRAEAMMCDLLVIKTCNHHNPWICWCF